MLDAKELAERLRAAMDLRDPPLGSSELARRCGVSKQAVYEWRTTGRMGKAHLLTVAQETGMPLEFFLEHARGSSTTTKGIWRRLGKAFAKVAMLAPLALALLLIPAPAEAESLFNISVARIHIAKLWARIIGFLASQIRDFLTALCHMRDEVSTVR